MKKLVKKILVRFKILTCVEPFYDFLISSLPKEKKRQKKLINFYSQFIKKGDLCFDIGAHRGKLKDIFLKLGARVIAV